MTGPGDEAEPNLPSSTETVDGGSSGSPAPVHASRPADRAPPSLQETAADPVSARPHKRKSRATVPSPGDRVGRYVIMEQLGAGAMGVVLAAYDPELDRKIALKLLHPRRGNRETQGRQRLLREAQAMAQLSHPNVVAVHDVGEHDRGVFVAMEFIEGQTLREWLGAGPRPVAEVLAVFRDAARGLQAAHEAALVHRDFKPENVMLDEGGRVRVLDFGLVLPLRRRSSDEVSVTGSSASLSRSSDAMTSREEAAMGTPAYMSPEQIELREVDARTDQFSFCVALYEALYGERPFRGQSFEHLAVNVLSGEIRDAPRRTAVPGWIRRVLVRGLAVDPAQRFSSMHALGQALAADPSRRRRRWIAVGSTVAILGGIVGANVWVDQQRRATCQRAGQELSQVLDEDARLAMRDGLRSQQLPFVDDTWTRLQSRLDDYQARWGAARQQVCLASTGKSQWSADRTVAATECLATGRAAVEQFVAMHREPSVELAIQADHAAANLPDVERCLDPEREHELVADTVDREASLALRRERSMAAIQWTLGEMDAAQDRLLRVRQKARTLGDRFAEAGAEHELARLWANRGDADEAAQAFRRSYVLWGQLDHPRQQLQVAAALAAHEAERRRNAELSRDWLTLAAMELPRLDESSVASEAAMLRRVESVVAVAEGDYDRARDAANEALAMALTLDDPDHPRVTPFRIAVASVAQRRGDYQEAKTLVEEQLARTRRTRGDHHPTVGRALTNVANIATMLGDLSQGEARAREAVELLDASLGPGHAWSQAARRNLASVLSKQGHVDDAIAVLEPVLDQADDGGAVATMLGGFLVQRGDHERAATLLRAAYEERRTELGDRHPDLVGLLINLGAAYRGSNDDERGAWAYREAIAVGRAALDADHPLLSYPLHNLGQLHHQRGDNDEARPLLTQALEIRRRKLGERHPMTASSLAALGTVALALGEHEEAVERLTLAREILAEREAYPERRAQATAALARALVARGDPPGEAVALMQQAVVGLREHGSAQRAEDAAQWLRDRGYALDPPAEDTR